MLGAFTFLVGVAGVSARVMDTVPGGGVPKGWKQLRDAEAAEPIALRIALRQSNSAELERTMLEVSTPGHPNYGMHLSRDEVRAFTAPSKRAVSDISGWLSEHGITPSVDNDFVTITTTVEKANKLLDTKFGWYQYQDNKEPKLRTLSYSVPDGLADHVDMVQPTTRFGQPVSKRSTIFKVVPAHLQDSAAADEVEVDVDGVVRPSLVAQAGCDYVRNVTPACLKQLYNIKYRPTNVTGSTIAFASYLEEYARYNDLQDFERLFVPEAKGQNFTTILVNGGLDDQNSRSDSGEANLDVDTIVGIANPIRIVQYSTAGRGPLVPTLGQPSPPGSNEPYLEFLTYLLARPDSELPQTLSTSYGEEEQSIPPEYALKVCNMFMQLGARGVSVLFSSGDSGPGGSCVRMTDMKTYFEPTFPAGCPYVTSVGATYDSPEKARDFSSGGFSIYHSRPAYQDAAVAPYLQTIGNAYAPYWNTSNRGIPDVSAQGYSFAVRDKGATKYYSGTSASCPAVAGMVALLNAARKSQGQPPLGFLNPWLYNNSAAHTDITTGFGHGCLDSTQARQTFGSVGARLNATKGWDPVTGLGTPIFDKYLAAAAPGVANA